jgi:uncharacterized protein YbcV (DUF1398 family)
LTETQAGKLIFPEVVRRLLEVGVESYFCDLGTGAETFYLSGGETHVEKMVLPLSPVAEDFSAPDVIAAIRGAQADKIRYPEFIKRSAAGGRHRLLGFSHRQKGHLLRPPKRISRRGFSRRETVAFSTPRRRSVSRDRLRTAERMKPRLPSDRHFLPSHAS